MDTIVLFRVGGRIDWRCVAQSLPAGARVLAVAADDGAGLMFAGALTATEAALFNGAVAEALANLGWDADRLDWLRAEATALPERAVVE